MQDRICQIDEILLQRTAGPYIRVTTRRTQIEHIKSASPRMSGHGADMRDRPLCATSGKLDGGSGSDTFC